MFLRAT